MSDNDTKVPLPDLENNGEVQTIDNAASLAPDLEPSTRGAADLEALFDVPVKVSAVLGRALIHRDLARDGELASEGADD